MMLADTITPGSQKVAKHGLHRRRSPWRTPYGLRTDSVRTPYGLGRDSVRTPSGVLPSMGSEGQNEGSADSVLGVHGLRGFRPSSVTMIIGRGFRGIWIVDPADFAEHRACR